MTGGKTYTCECCGQTFQSDWTDEDAAREFRATFPNADIAERAEVCEPCYIMLKAICPSGIP
jgi:hypothetical protein